MLYLRLAVLLVASANLAGIAHGQANVTVYVGYNATQAFRDDATGSTSSFDGATNTTTPAVTKIHEGDTIQFVWQGSLHNINPYDTTYNGNGFSVSKNSTQLMGSSTWSGPDRRTTYQCDLHPTRMKGEVYVYEVARSFVIAAPAKVGTSTPFNVTVTAAGQNGTADGLFLGTIRFSSSDSNSGVVLPADYAFVETDKGVHKFTGLVLKTVNAAATITVNATAGGLTGQATLGVDLAPSPPRNVRVSP